MGATCSVHDASAPERRQTGDSTHDNSRAGCPLWCCCGDSNATALSPSVVNGLLASSEDAVIRNDLVQATSKTMSPESFSRKGRRRVSSGLRSSIDFYSQLAFVKEATRTTARLPRAVTGTSVVRNNRQNSFRNHDGTVISPLAELLEAPKEAGQDRDAIFKAVTEKVERFSGVSIAKLRVDPKDDDPVTKLGILQYIRGAFRIQLKQLPSVRLVKADDERVFLAGRSLPDLVKAGLALLHLCADLTGRFPDFNTTCSVGVAAGGILLLPSDYYGNAVNTASKLGEDNASPGDLAVSGEALDLVKAAPDGQVLLQNLVLADKDVQISGVDIAHVLITLPPGASAQCAYPDAAIPSDADVYQSLSSATSQFCAEALVCLEALQMDWGVSKGMQSLQDIKLSLTHECTMMQTDMSGFTRLTRKYGIMHFLALIMQCRKIYDDTIAPFGGRVIKYDGDNVITFFPTPEMGAMAASRILRKVNEYNRGLNKDFQIRLKFGISSGRIMMVGEDIAGSAWDDCCTLGEDLAEVDEILITKPVRDALAKSEATEVWSMYFEERSTHMKDSSKCLIHYNMQPLFLPDNPSQTVVGGTAWRAVRK